MTSSHHLVLGVLARDKNAIKALESVNRMNHPVLNRMVAMANRIHHRLRLEELWAASYGGEISDPKWRKDGDGWWVIGWNPTPARCCYMQLTEDDPRLALCAAEAMYGI